MKLHLGNNIDILKQYPDNHFDSIVTDPPYGIEFLAKEWDKNTGAVETWKQCFRVLKPGGYLLAFSAARTYHHLATNIESVGFKIRDQLMWLYSSGFPKAQDIGKAIDKRNGINESLKPPIQSEWAGWKTALKPAHEPIVMARKPFRGSTVDNVLEHGVGALNIDATRISFDEDTPYWKSWKKNSLQTGGPIFQESKQSIEYSKSDTETYGYSDQGRFPSNVIGEVEGYQKFFYCPKVSRAERHIGCENNHPTVKPVALMKYLVKMVTPVGGKVLDPFTGSGSTGIAAVELDYDFTGCELDENYVNIAETRITAWKNKTDLENNPLPTQWFEEE